MYWNTISEVLRDSLVLLMNATEFSQFRLVGGTSLSLQIGHRMSIDIDLFTDSPYSTVNFDTIENFLSGHFNYVDTSALGLLPGMGCSYFVGFSMNNSIKLDIYYTDSFIQPPIVIDHIRMATIEEIIAMKIDVVSRGGRKKDFWDIHELLTSYSISEMLALHEQRYPYSHDKKQIITNFYDFENADNDFEPICLKGKYWELIKLDIINALNENSEI